MSDFPFIITQLIGGAGAFIMGTQWRTRRARRIDANTLAASRVLLDRLEEFEVAIESPHDAQTFYGSVFPAITELRVMLQKGESA